MSICPQSPITFSTNWSGTPGCVRSPAKTRVSPSISFEACSATSPSRSLIRTLAPCSARISAVARPMPRAEPVTIATLPSRTVIWVPFRSSICFRSISDGGMMPARPSPPPTAYCWPPANKRCGRLVSRGATLLPAEADISDGRLNKSRLGRGTRLGGMAAGAAARQLGTRIANRRRTPDEAQDALGRQALEMADRIVKVLGGMKGAAMKVGQTLSVLDPGVVPGPYREEFQAKLAQLQTMAPSVSFKDMRKVIEQDLGERLGAAFAEFDEEAIAAASIGQVFRARLHDGRDVAVKVQYPGIKDVVRADLKNLGLVLR